MGQFSVLVAFAASLLKVMLEWLRQKSLTEKAKKSDERVRSKALRTRYHLLLRALKARRSAKFLPKGTDRQENA